MKGHVVQIKMRRHGVTENCQKCEIHKFPLQEHPMLLLHIINRKNN